MKNWSYSSSEKTVITEAIILLCAWAHCISDVAHSKVPHGASVQATSS